MKIRENWTMFGKNPETIGVRSEKMENVRDKPGKIGEYSEKTRKRS